MGNIIVFGDQFAGDSLYDLPGERKPINGVPVNDVSLHRMAALCFENYDTIFWANSYPLMGAEALIKYPQYLAIPSDIRILPYHKMPEKRGFYNKDFWKALSLEETSAVVQNYFELNEIIMGRTSGKFIILPIAAYLFDRILNLNLNIYNRLFDYGWNVVNLDVLNEISNEQAFTQNNVLTRQAFDLIKPEIFKFIKEE